jgi:hypothetical protein
MSIVAARACTPTFDEMHQLLVNVKTVAAGVMMSVENTIYEEPRRTPAVGANERNCDGASRGESSPIGQFQSTRIRTF